MYKYNCKSAHYLYYATTFKVLSHIAEEIRNREDISNLFKLEKLMYSNMHEEAFRNGE